MPVRSIICLGILLGCVVQPATVSAQSTQPYLYWAASELGEIWRAPADGSSIEVLTQPFDVEAVALDVTGQHMYFGGSRIGNDSGALYRSNLDGGERLLLAETGRKVRAIELDLSGGKIYWYEATGSPSGGRILRANLDGSGLEVLISGLSSSESLALDLANAKMYWGQFTGGGIRRANLDGSNVETLNPLVNVRNIEIDTSNANVYVSAETGLQRCDLDVANCSTLVMDTTRGMEIDGDTVYFQLFTDGSIWTMDLDGMNQQQVTSGLPRTNEFRLDAVNGHYYFPDSSIFRSDLDGSNQIPLVGGVGISVHDVAVDPDNDLFYFTDFRLGSLGVSSIDPLAINSVFPGRSTLDDFNEIRGMAIDLAGQRLFVADYRGPPNGGIWRVDLSGPSRTKIVTGLDDIHDVAVDPVEEKLYWIGGVSDSGDPGGVIQRSDFDGSNQEIIISALPQLVRGIDIDATNRKLYWTDMHDNQVHRANLDGTSPEVVINGASMIHDVALDPLADRMYWVENIDDSSTKGAMIRTASLDGSSPADLITGLSLRTRDLTVVYHRSLLRLKDGFESQN